MDGLAISRLARDWQQTLVGARIERIHQPEERSIVLTLRTQSGTKRLLLSAHRRFARAYILERSKPENPLQPPMFCMVLRKRLETGRITRIEQPGWERILSFGIEARNEIGDVVVYRLIAELMGKHSNLMLCEERAEGLKIIDSIMHVPHDVSRVRQVLPGLFYTLPPAQEKASVDALRPAELDGWLEADRKEAIRRITRSIHGFGPASAEEALHRAAAISTGTSGKRLTQSLRQLVQISQTGSESPSIGQSELGKPLACAPFTLTAWPTHTPCDTFDAALETFYEEFAAKAAQSQRQSDLTRTLEDVLDRLRGKRAKLEAELERGSHHDEDRIKAELITAYAWHIEKGQSSVALPNFYAEDQLMQIELDPSKTAIENAQALYKRASKRKRAFLTLQDTITETNTDIAYVEACLNVLQQGDAAHLDELRQELVEQGFLKPERSKSGKKRGKAEQRPSRADTYVSSDGLTIRVGRNNLQNDQLTFRSSRPNDLWLHVKDQPGSHVVITCNDRQPPQQTVDEAALLAAYFSKGRDSANVAVDVTEIRNVWKPNGARPGFALYKGQRTLYVTPDRQLVSQIQSQTPPAP